MKKILVTGASGAIGIKVLANLLEDNYEITALDLKNSKNTRRLNKFKGRINIVYGDIDDKFLMESLIKDHDYIIHLAGVMPPFANLKKDLCRIVDFEGTKNIIEAINNSNPNCFLIYASSTSIYGKNKKCNTSSAIDIDDNDYYSIYKAATEDEIKNNLKNYCILRIPIILGDPSEDALVYNGVRSQMGEFLTSSDAALAFSSSISQKTKINKKIFNIAGGEKCRLSYRQFLSGILNNYGLTLRYIITLLLVDKNYKIHYYEDTAENNEILNYQTEGINDYFTFVKKIGKKRIIRRVLAKPFIWVLKK